MAELNIKKFCAHCGLELKGQSYKVPLDWTLDLEPISCEVCQTCELKRIVARIKDREFVITLTQTEIKDLKKRRAKVEKNEPEFS